MILVSLILSSCSIIIANCNILSLTTNVNPIIPCKFLRGLQICSVSITLTFQVDFHPNYSHPWQCFITSGWQEKVTFFTKMNELIIIHDNICSLNHKKRHPKSYHGDVKHHIVTLNIIFNVAPWRLRPPACSIFLWFPNFPSCSVSSQRGKNDYWFYGAIRYIQFSMVSTLLNPEPQTPASEKAYQENARLGDA